jgi:hypothetical protein
MGSKRPQTMAKRARELAVKERRERKQAKKAAAAAQRSAASDATVSHDPATEQDSPAEAEHG